MNPTVNTELSLFCPCQEFDFYQKIDNKITKDGSYKTKTDKTPRQMYYCHGGKHRFSSSRYSDLFQKQGSFKEYEMASKMVCYGLSQTQIAEVLERDVRTVEEWLQKDKVQIQIKVKSERQGLHINKDKVQIQIQIKSERHGLHINKDKVQIQIQIQIQIKKKGPGIITTRGPFLG